MTRRVAIIGAGSSGLTSIKCCLDEGLEPVCFESSDDIGGLWRFKINPESDRASIYDSVIINTSKEMMCFSDYPIPSHFPNFMHHSVIMQYFQKYVQHFNLLPYIHFKTTVCSVTPLSGFSEWEVLTKNKDGVEEKHVFEAVMICIGHHVFPNVPVKDFPGFETFKGKWFHSRDYKSPEEWRGKKVVVIGIGSSGGDIAVELSRVTQKVFLSTRRGAWVLNRVGTEGIPTDMEFTRLQQQINRNLPINIISKLGEKRLNQRFNHSLYSLQPKHRLFSQHPTINDELPNRIISGTITVKPNIARFEGSSVIFEDGTVEENVDLVIFATGYQFSFPFLTTSVCSVVQNKVSLYKFVFPPELEQPRLAIIGLVQPLGAIMPIAELQARWVTRVFKGLCKLPSKKSMLKDIKSKAERMANRYVASQRHTIQVDYLDYMDEVAKQVGVQPNILVLMLWDPRLALNILLGPCTPYQFRLRGPGKWAGARQAILTQWERVAEPMRTRPVPQPNTSKVSVLVTLTAAAGVLVAGVCVYIILSFLQQSMGFIAHF